MTKGFIVGFISALVVLAVGGYLFVIGGGLYAGQDVHPGGLERWGAKTSLRAAVRQEAGELKSPLLPIDENLLAGASLYRAHCQVCHGGPDGVASAIASGLTPTAPQLAKHGVEDDPVATTYWKIAHGIRFTGMPAFRKSLSEEQMWQVALFAAHLSALPPRTQAAWRIQSVP